MEVTPLTDKGGAGVGREVFRSFCRSPVMGGGKERGLGRRSLSPQGKPEKIKRNSRDWQKQADPRMLRH